MNLLKTVPAVFAVGRNYQILVPVRRQSLAWARIGNACYYDASNGILRSRTRLHRIEVPMQVLDEAKSYTLCLRPVRRRKAYRTKTGPLKEITFPFRPVPMENARAYHIADAHNLVSPILTAARAFGDMDFLILNGDIISHSGHRRHFDNLYKLCAALTGGSIPVVFARGNHDMRGKYAEQFPDFTPTQNGNTYYSFRLGSIWGVVLDCGEDKPDDCPEYGGTVACHGFRQRQTEFLKALTAHPETEYAAAGIQTKLVICHVPFTERDEPPFDIEPELYRRWCALLQACIQPHLMLCGHTHRTQVRYPGHPRDTYGQSCPVVIASGFDDRRYWTGCGFTFEQGRVTAVFTDSEGNISTPEHIHIPKSTI